MDLNYLESETLILFYFQHFESETLILFYFQQYAWEQIKPMVEEGCVSNRSKNAQDLFLEMNLAFSILGLHRNNLFSSTRKYLG